MRVTRKRHRPYVSSGIDPSLVPTQVGRPEISDEQAEELRDKVPHTPVKLPPGHLTCQTCGVATAPPDAPHSKFNDQERRQLGWSKPELVVRCFDCEELHLTAVETLERYPVLSATDPQALNRLEGTFIALVLLDRAMPEVVSPFELMMMCKHLGVPGLHARWSGQQGTCSPRPFSHVMPGARQAIRTGYASFLRERMSLGAPPALISPPFTTAAEDQLAIVRACLLCGVAGVRMPAVQVVRLGGLQAARGEVWTKESASPYVLGGPPSAIRLVGHTCPPCTRAIDRDGIGQSAMREALLAYLRGVGRGNEAEQLGTLFAAIEPKMWAYGALVYAHTRSDRAWEPSPSEQPWSHLLDLGWLKALVGGGQAAPVGS